MAWGAWELLSAAAWGAALPLVCMAICRLLLAVALQPLTETHYSQLARPQDWGVDVTPQLQTLQVS